MSHRGNNFNLIRLLAAVSVFFVVSGYLATASLRSRQSITHFLLARARRIYPAL